jgi:hypothetical protein
MVMVPWMMGKCLPVAIIQLSTAPESASSAVSDPLPLGTLARTEGGPTPLLKTYEEVRLLWDMKGWGIVAVLSSLQRTRSSQDLVRRSTQQSCASSPGSAPGRLQPSAQRIKSTTSSASNRTSPRI